MNFYKLFLRTCAVLLGLSGILLAVGCAGTNKLADRTTASPLAFGSEGGTVPFDTLHAPTDSLPKIGVVVVPHRSALDKLLGRKPEPKAYPANAYIGKVGKKATIYYGPATISGKKATVAAGESAAAVSGKKAGPVVKADSGASLNYATTGRGQAASGEGITQTEAPPERSLLSHLLPGGGLIGAGLLVGILGAIALGCWFAFGGGMPALGVLWAWVRRKTSNE